VNKDNKQAKITDENREESRKLRVIYEGAGHGLTQAEFGERYKIGSQSAVGFFLGGKSAISMKAAVGFADGLGCKIVDFSPRLAREAAGVVALMASTGASIESSPRVAAAADPDLVMIPQYNTGGRMGHGLILRDQPGIIKTMYVNREWLGKNLRSFSNENNLCIVTGYGDSMRGMFNPGDPLVVDTGVKSVEVDGVYFFRVGDEGYIKRLQRIPMLGGAILRARSENPVYEPFDIVEGMDFEVFGRVLKAWTSEDY
jgi:Peptidase S24-like